MATRAGTMCAERAYTMRQIHTRCSALLMLTLVAGSLAACTASSDEDTGSADAEQREAASVLPEQCREEFAKEGYTPYTPKWATISYLNYGGLGGSLLRVGVVAPPGEIKGDVLYIPGFGDRFDNQKPLFDEFLAKGLRVISFDHPSHGESCGKSLKAYGIEDIMNIAITVEAVTRGQDTVTRSKQPVPDRPLYLAAYSAGGMVGVRLLQQKDPFERPIKAAVLLAPAVSVHMFGDFGRDGVVVYKKDDGTMDERAVCSNPDAHVAPANRAILSKPTNSIWFAADLAWNTWFDADNPMQRDIPVFVTMSGFDMRAGTDKDFYSKTSGIKSWFEAQQKTRSRGSAPLQAISCDGAHHEMANEPEPIGQTVRSAAAAFFSDPAHYEFKANKACKPL